MHRFFLTDRPLEPGAEVDLAPLAHQLRAVLRMAPGDRILLLDGSGHAYPTEILALGRREARGRILDRQPLHTEPPIHVTLYLCALKGEKFEWVLQKGTELGVARFVPVISARTIVRPAEALRRKYRRWQAILREAAEQSGRAHIPELGEPLTWSQAVAHGEGMRFLIWEKAGEPGLGTALSRLAGPRVSVSPPEPEASPSGSGEVSRVSLLVGPEGGITREEAIQAQEAGWTAVGLGPRILRAETAALAAATLVLHYRGDLG